MSNSMRALCAVLFFAAMAGMRYFVHSVAEFGGLLAVLALIPLIFWIGVKMENRDREADGRPPYSAYEAGQDFREVAKTFPILGALLLFAVAVHYLT